VPEPLPERQQQQARPSGNTQDQQQPTAQTFAGTIVKDGTKYILKESSGTIYQLDGDAKQYEGKQVRIANLNTNNEPLHVSSIQLIP